MRGRNGHGDRRHLMNPGCSADQWTSWRHFKGRFKLYLLRRWRCFGVQRMLLKTFFDSVVSDHLWVSLLKQQLIYRREEEIRYFYQEGFVLGWPFDTVQTAGDKRTPAKRIKPDARSRFHAEELLLSKTTVSLMHKGALSKIFPSGSCYHYIARHSISCLHPWSYFFLL